MNGALPALTCLIVARYVGVLAEKRGGLNVIKYALIAYSIIVPLLSMVKGLSLIILWLLPIWPLHHVGINVATSQLTSVNERGEAMGAINTCYNIAVLISIVGGGIADVIGREQSIMLASIPLIIASVLITYYTRAIRGGS